MTYHMEVKLDGVMPYSLEVTVPPRENDIASFRLDRLGGLSPADRRYRATLFEAIGAITVASGHAEAAMKRVLISLRGGTSQFRDVDKNWTELVKNLRRLDASQDQRATRVHEVLTWAETNGIKEKRDAAVHSYWWAFADLPVMRSRFERSGESSAQIGDMESLMAHGDLIFEFARRLDDLVVSDWPQARLPHSEA
ncbi:hypothetical protein [Xylanimonas protaetiae]|uniref:Uncharacterized protein n=1 Tax=Xylanimonas protaetiae TaxID=2509457 RepID=A0A4P6FBE4_9MICO|nr:hypothetical protein [Xylanimonas protaetiae]QAY71619.1 hypothetical protein ET471_17570 [Xylanimonas protaetiae]